MAPQFFTNNFIERLTVNEDTDEISLISDQQESSLWKP